MLYGKDTFLEIRSIGADSVPNNEDDIVVTVKWNGRNLKKIERPKPKENSKAEVELEKEKKPEPEERQEKKPEEKPWYQKIFK